MSPTIRYDEQFQFTRPVQDGPRRTDYPFLANGDFAARIYTRSLLIRESEYVPPKAGTERDSIWAGGDPDAYNLEDPPPEWTGIGDLLRINRRYARIPGNQSTPGGSRYITFPTPVNQFGAGGDYLTAVEFALNASLGQGMYQGGALWTSADKKLYRAKVVTANTDGKATGGTFTISYLGNVSTSIAYNASAATVKSAIEGITGVSGVLTVSITNNLATTGQLIIVVATGIAVGLFTMDATSLTVSTSKHPVTAPTTVTAGSGTSAQYISLPHHLTITGHGLNTSNRLAAVTETGRLLVFESGDWGSIDTDTIWVPAEVVSYSLAGDYVRDYKPGSFLVPTRLDESFYLPGVTGGISDWTDITVPDCCQDPDVLFAALVGASGWQPYDPDGPKAWAGAIQRLGITYINLNDV